MNQTCFILQRFNSGILNKSTPREFILEAIGAGVLMGLTYE